MAAQAEVRAVRAEVPGALAELGEALPAESGVRGLVLAREQVLEQVLARGSALAQAPARGQALGQAPASAQAG